MSHFGVGRGCLCICPLVRMFLPWISAQVSLSLSWVFCSNITLLMKPSLIILHNIARPTSPFSRQSLSYLLCLIFLHSIYYWQLVCCLTLAPLIISTSHNILCIRIMFYPCKSSVNLCEMLMRMNDCPVPKLWVLLLPHVAFPDTQIVGLKVWALELLA